MKLLELRNLLSFLAASISGMVLYFKFPFPEMHVFLNLIKFRDPATLCFLKYSYVSFLFATPFFGFSLLTSFLYLFVFGSYRRRTKPDTLPPYPQPTESQELFLILGKVHNRRKPVPVENPQWLIMPEKEAFSPVSRFSVPSDPAKPAAACTHSHGNC